MLKSLKIKILLVFFIYFGCPSYGQNVPGLNIRYYYAAGTEILIPGNKAFKIKNIQPGNSIISYDLNTAQLKLSSIRKVSNVLHNNIIKIYFSDGTINQNTFNCIYFTKKKEWCSYKPDKTKKQNELEAGRLEVGDIVYKMEAGILKEIKIVRIEPFTEEILVYNLILEYPYNNYFANGILVHSETMDSTKTKPSFRVNPKNNSSPGTENVSLFSSSLVKPSFRISPPPGSIAYYEADVKSYSDYYPFGMLMNGRKDDNYRFGFNGMEKDNELKGEGNSLDFGSRIYDSRLGSFFSIDSDYYKYVWNSPYSYAINSPIKFIDKNGLGPDKITNNSNSKIKLTGSSEIKFIIKGKNEKVIDFGELRGSIVLNPGDIYYEMDNDLKATIAGDEGTIQGGYGKIIRNNGDVDYVFVNDVDYIDVEIGQKFIVDGKEVTNDHSKEFNRLRSDGDRKMVPTESVLSTEEVDNVKESDTSFKPKNGWTNEPNKGEIKLDDWIGELKISDEEDKTKKKTGRIKVEKPGIFGAIETN